MDHPVGLRELKNQLSRYVRQARDGEAVLISDRGVIVAELIAPRSDAKTGKATTTIEEMRRKGLLYAAGTNDPSLYPPLSRTVKRSSSSRLLDDERAER